MNSTTNPTTPQIRFRRLLLQFAVVLSILAATFGSTGPVRAYAPVPEPIVVTSIDLRPNSTGTYVLAFKGSGLGSVTSITFELQRDQDRAKLVGTKLALVSYAELQAEVDGSQLFASPGIITLSDARGNSLVLNVEVEWTPCVHGMPEGGELVPGCPGGGSYRVH